MKINLRKFYAYILIVLLIYSKFFYLSMFTLSSYNFTLTDLCIVMMFLYLLFNNKLLKDAFYNRIIIYSIIIACLFSVGSLIQNTSLIGGLVAYIKRWIGLIVIPVYIKNNFQKRDIKKIIVLLNVVVLIFGIINYDSLMSSISSQRFNLAGTIGPNIWGVLMAVLIIVTSFIDINPIIKTMFLFTEVIFLISTSSRAAIFSFFLVVIIINISKLKRANMKRVIVSLFILLMILIFGKYVIGLLESTFPYSYNRIMGTIVHGILNDNSASSRINTGLLVLKYITSNLFLLIFGTGYGNGNMYDAFYKQGYLINTADNMYINMLAWSGIIALFLYLFIIYKILLRTLNSKENELKNATTFITIYLLVAGLGVETFNEPTIGAVYMLILGLYEISKMDANKKHPSMEVIRWEN